MSLTIHHDPDPVSTSGPCASPLARVTRRAPRLLTLSVAALLALGGSPRAFGADRALLVGVDTYLNRDVPPTPGCRADAEKTAAFLRSKFAFPPSSVKILLDSQATASNIVKEFREWLVAGTGPGDRVFFLYSGHGSQLPDDDGDEKDRYDETIAPFDVDPRTGANEIRDDVFNGLIASLSGRRAALLFDSCHSGTISRGVPKLGAFPRGGGARYLPRPDQFAAIETAGGESPGPGRGRDAGYIVTESRSRDILAEPFVSTKKTGDLSGVVVISAASPYQAAYPFAVGGELRGALSYAFVEALATGAPSLRQVESDIKARIDALHRSGALDGDQQPDFEIISAVPLNDEPLFGTWEQAPLVALTNPLSPMKVKIQTRGEKPYYAAGERISYRVATDTPGYLYLVVFSRQQVATCIFPNSQDLNNHVPAGTLDIPTNSRYSFEVQAPYGRDVVVALLSGERLNIGDKETNTWSEIFDRLDLKGLQTTVTQLSMRSIGVKQTRAPLAMTQWQGASVVVETRP